MKTHLGITVPNPCHENWQEMTPTEKGRHCATCEEEVIDFTSLTKKEMHAIIINNDDICGNFRKDQLNTPLYFKPSTTRHWKKYAASLLFPAALFITNEGFSKDYITGSFSNKTTPTTQVSKNYKSLGISSLSRKRDTINQKSHLITGTITDGHIVLVGTDVIVKGTQRSTKTKEDGTYEIYVNKGDTLIFLRLGYKNKEIVYESQKTISPILQSELVRAEPFLRGKIKVVKDSVKNNR